MRSLITGENSSSSCPGRIIELDVLKILVCTLNLWYDSIMNNTRKEKSHEVKIVDLYISVDIEASGPIPGPYYMSSLGASAAGGLTNTGEYVKFDHTDEDNLFYSELKPLPGSSYIPEAINVGYLEGFDKSIPDPDGSRHYEWTLQNGEDPARSMRSFSDFVERMKKKHGGMPVFMAYPAGFDWTFVYWYFIKHNLPSPFGFSRVLDLKTVYSSKTARPMKKSNKRSMPRHLFPDLPHTHKADEDALEQGVFGMNMLQWEIK